MPDDTKRFKLIHLLLIFAPLAIVLDLMRADHTIIFIISSIAILPLAKLIGDSTEHLEGHYGEVTGSLMNVTFGNAAELIIALTALNARLFDLIKASVTGSIIGNVLLVFGLSMIAGGIRRKEQVFNSANANVQTSMLFLAIIGLAVPTILAETELKPSNPANVGSIQLMSDTLAFTLLAVYLAALIFTFVTHKHLFVSAHIDEEHGNHATWSKKKALVILGIAMALVAVISEILIGSVEETSKQFGFGELFVGAVVVGLVGNAAEHSSAIILARKDKLDASIGIAAGSGTQIALFVVPLLIIAGIVMGKPLTLVFTVYELAAVFLAAIIMNLISHDGRSNWFEGFMMTAVYVIIATGFFFIK